MLLQGLTPTLIDTESYQPVQGSGITSDTETTRATAPNPDDHFVLIDRSQSSNTQPTKPPPGGPQDPDDEDGSITDILSARMGALRIVEDGQLRYYGPTSNLHVHSDGLQSLSSPSFRRVSIEGIQVLRRLGLDREVPLAMEAHLANLYFAWEDPAIHVVDQDTFFAEKRRCLLQETNSPYYSETLNNAM